MNTLKRRTMIGVGTARTILLIAVLALVAAALSRPTPAASQDGIEVFFSPKGGCTEVIIDEIDNATEAILVQAYSFTSAPIAKELLGAWGTCT